MQIKNRTFRAAVDDQGIATVTVDVEDQTVNTMRSHFGTDFNELWSGLESVADLNGIVFISAKDHGFLAGANVNLLAEASTREEMDRITHTAQKVCSMVADSRVPVVAAVHGACAGGGAELALAADYIVAADTIRIGLPEVKLGLTPGAGGTWRLPQRIGMEQALPLLLKGKLVPGAQAVDLGLVDEIVSDAALERAAKLRVMQLARNDSRPRNNHASLARRTRHLLVEDNLLGRSLMFRRARSELARRDPGEHRAPQRLIDLLEEVCTHNDAQGALRAEREAFVDLAMGRESRNLVALFLSDQQIRQEQRERVDASDGQAPRYLGVIGAGTMGAGIAYVAAAGDQPVRLIDTSEEVLANGLQATWRRFEKVRQRHELSSYDAHRKFRSIAPTVRHTGLARTDLVIEAVSENPELKHEIYQQLSEAIGSHTVLATNTSAIPLAELADSVPDPTQFVGLHYFSPVEKMPLIEIVVGELTSSKTVAICLQAARAHGKKAVCVRDKAGFFTTRILAAYLAETAKGLGEGIPVAAIDSACKAQGFPMGPLELIDQVGLKTVTEIGSILGERLGEAYRASPALESMVEAGLGGKDSGAGFYHYEDGQRGEVNRDIARHVNSSKKQPADHAAEDCAVRGMLRLVREALVCLDEGVIDSPRDGDFAAVYGLGFPPHWGGPFRYADQRGIAALSDQLRELTAAHGEAFGVPDGLQRRRQEGATYYPGDSLIRGGRRSLNQTADASDADERAESS